MLYRMCRVEHVTSAHLTWLWKIITFHDFTTFLNCPSIVPLASKSLLSKGTRSQIFTGHGGKVGEEALTELSVEVMRMVA